MSAVAALFGVEEEWLVLLSGVLAFGGLFVALAGARAHDRLVTRATEDKR